MQEAVALQLIGNLQSWESVCSSACQACQQIAEIAERRATRSPFAPRQRRLRKLRGIEACSNPTALGTHEDVDASPPIRGDKPTIWRQ